MRKKLVLVNHLFVRNYLLSVREFLKKYCNLARSNAIDNCLICTNIYSRIQRERNLILTNPLDLDPMKLNKPVVSIKIRLFNKPHDNLYTFLNY